jgi:signal peptidase I
MPRLSYRRRLSANMIAVPASPRRPRPLTDLLKVVAFILILLAIGLSLMARYTIQQTSMEPNFHPGQGVMVSRTGLNLGSWLNGSAYAAHPSSASLDGLEHGQIVIFFASEDHAASPLIKRLIGMPGDHVDIHDGAVFINQQQLSEPYLSATTTDCAAHCSLTLGSNEYFFLGDNRAVSWDSRQFGTITGDQIVGRVVLRFWPLDDLTLFL